MKTDLLGITVADVGDIFNLPPYGCARRCYLQKIGEPGRDACFINDEHHKKDIVKIYSDFIADIYHKHTKRKIRSMNQPYFVNPKYPYIFGDCDRYISKHLMHSTEKYVPLEIRVLNHPEFYSIRRDGLPGNYYNYQLHHQMIAKNSPWASLAIFSPDVLSMLTFDFAYDEMVAAEVITAERDFWSAVEGRTGYEKLTMNNGQSCPLCGYRHMCLEGIEGGYEQATKERLELKELRLQIAEYVAREEKKDVEA